MIAVISHLLIKRQNQFKSKKNKHLNINNLNNNKNATKAHMATI